MLYQSKLSGFDHKCDHRVGMGVGRAVGPSHGPIIDVSSRNAGCGFYFDESVNADRRQYGE